MKIRQWLGAVVISLMVTIGIASADDTKPKTPFDYSFLTYLWVLLLSAFAGAVSFFRKMREGRARPFNLTEFVGELVTSSLAGLLTFWLTEAADFNKLISAVLIAISGHMGSRAIFAIEKWAEDKFGAGGMPGGPSS